jgi:hypothetical protein
MKMKLTITTYTDKFNLTKIKLEYKYNNYTYFLSEISRGKITEDIYYIFTKIRNEDNKIISTNDNNIILPTYKNHSNKICKRIFYYINYINKLDDGKIKEYQIFNKFELYVLCNYLINKNIVHEIVIKYKNKLFKYEAIKKFRYNSDKYQKSINGYIETIYTPEENKVPTFLYFAFAKYKKPTLSCGVLLALLLRLKF